MLLTTGPVAIAGTAEFALTRQTAGVGTDANGSADMLGATVNAVALRLTGGARGVDGIADLDTSPAPAVARVTPAGWAPPPATALKMGEVSVKVRPARRLPSA